MSRRPRSPIEGGNGDVQSLGNASGEVGTDVRDASLDSIDLEVGCVQPVGQVLATESFGFTDFPNPTSHERWRLSSHILDLSDPDRRFNHQSGSDSEPGDIARAVERRAHDLSFEECEQWARELGYVDGDKVDWGSLLREAGVKSTQYVLKSRWEEGGAPRDRLKIRETLERAETKRRERTPAGARILGLERWQQIGRDLSTDPNRFALHLHRLEPIARAAREAYDARVTAAEKDAELQALEAGFQSPTPGRKDRR
jgi:hypothetical protein